MGPVSLVAAFVSCASILRSRNYRRRSVIAAELCEKTPHRFVIGDSRFRELRGDFEQQIAAKLTYVAAGSRMANQRLADITRRPAGKNRRPGWGQLSPPQGLDSALSANSTHQSLNSHYRETKSPHVVKAHLEPQQSPRCLRASPRQENVSHRCSYCPSPIVNL